MKMQILFTIYLAGYRGWLAPRWLRRLLAKSIVHRTWFAGYHGVYYEDGKKVTQWNKNQVNPFHDMQYYCSQDWG